MKRNYKKYTLAKQSFSRAFRSSSGDGSQGLEVYTKDGEAPRSGASLSETSLGKFQNEPLGYGDGRLTRLSLLEGLIHDLALKGDSKGLSKVLKEYCEVYIELERGGDS